MVNIKRKFGRLALAGALCVTSVVAAANPSQRIIGGQPSAIEATPSIVALISTRALEANGSALLSQFCGGTLIAPTWVLTAAHCLVIFGDVLPADEVQVVANTDDLNNIVGDPIEVARVIVHERYNELTSENDIALLQLVSPAVQSSAVATMNTTPVPINESLLTAGWGARQFNFSDGSFDFPNNLHSVEVLSLPAAQCNTLPAYAGDVTDTMLCAGFVNGGRDSCQGDSGGPLYRQDADGALTVAGITSWGEGCALAERPGVYTDVASFNDWIRNNASTSEGTPVFVLTEAEDGSTLFSLPTLSALSSSGGSVSFWISVMLAGFITFRRRND